MATTAKTLTTKQVIAGFNVGHMTVYNWRKGTASQDQLPTHVDDAGKVSFKLAEIVAWAKKYERPFDATQVDAAPAAKPGPKPKAKPSESPAMKDAKAKAPAARHTKTAAAPLSEIHKVVVAGKTKADKGMSKTGRKIAVAAKKASKPKAGKLKTAANVRLAKGFEAPSPHAAA